MPATEQTWRSQKLLHKLFAIGSLFLLIATVWMFAKDHDRQWKEYQRDQIDIDLAYSNFDEVRVAAEQNEDKLVELKEQLFVAQSSPPEKELVDAFIAEMAKGYRQQAVREGNDASSADPRIEAKKSEILAAYDSIKSEPESEFETEAEETIWRAQQKRNRDALLKIMGDVLGRATFLEANLLDARKMKSAELDAAKSILDLAVRDDKSTVAPQRSVDQVTKDLTTLTLHYQQASDHRAALQKIIENISAPVRRIDKKIADNRAEMDQIAKKIDDRQSNWIEGYWLGKKLLESPILDAFNSPLKIENLWTEGLTHNYYNFKPVLRYDRCTTCHQAMEQTQAGSAVDPKYESVHELTFALQSPTEEEMNKLLGRLPPDEGGEAADGNEELADAEEIANNPPSENLLYGFTMAVEGILNRDDVTINYVRDQSAAAKARLSDDEAGMQYLSAELIEASASAAFDAEGLHPPQFGLRPGDVIVSIGGDKILSHQDVHRKLLETVTWGQSIKIKVRRGFPHPHATHPRLDLFVGSTSPHKLQDVGCTVCHEGQGSATEFKWVSHSPNSLKQRDEWRKEYGWFSNHHWIFPMFPKRFAESSCLKCHHDVVELEPSERFPEPPAPQLMAGYDNVRKYGCFGCHEVVGYDGPDKRIGPDLRLEPNYFAAGLQLAHMSEQRVAELEGEMEETSSDGDESLATHLEALREAIERGNRLGSAPDNNDNRHRLLELITDDQRTLKKKQEAAAEKGEELDYTPTFTPEIYDTAMVLKDDETPGQFRKVGPSLRYVDAKLDQPFLDDWIREPKHFRPSSRMPQFFRLFDHIQGESTDPQERAKQTKEMRHHTAELEDIEIQGIRSYLQHYSQPFEPVEGGDEAMQAAGLEGDITRGKVLFEIGGCLACHSNADFPGQGDQGPDLTGLGSKLVGKEGRTWLYGWIQNPKRYHARTKMPIVPLKPLPGNEETDPIADVVEYLLADTSDWESAYAENEVDAERLDELALMHLKKTFSTSVAEKALAHGLKESRRSTLKGAEVEILVADELVDSQDDLSQEQKLLYIGSKSISKYGCYACHDIPGFEGAKPIGTALSDWGRKDPSKLAFEHITHYVGHGAHGGHANGKHGNGAHGDVHGEHEDEGGDEQHEAAHDMAHDEHEHADPADLAYYEHELHHHSRIGFIHQKLKEPRSYDYAKLANKDYNDRLRMPMFPLDHEQHEEIITFVLGLVADPPPEQFVYSPPERQKAINEGRVVLDRYNCAGCHELQREEWTLTIPDDWDRLSDPAKPTTYPFLVPHVTHDDKIESQEVSRSGRISTTVKGRVKRGSRGDLEVLAWDPIDEDYLPIAELEKDAYPVGSLAYEFELYEPTLINGQLFMPKDSLPAIPVEMVKKRQAAWGGDLASYLLPRVLNYTTSANRTKGEEAWGWVPPSLVDQGNKTNPDWLHAFLLDPHPIRPAAMLNMPKFNMSADEATKLVNYFAARDRAEYPYQFDQRKRDGHLSTAQSTYRQAFDDLPGEEKDGFSGDRFDDIMRIVTSQAGCVKCHSVGDYVMQGDPRAMGPNLSDVRRRLQPDYVRRWIAKPSYILPYTAMPELIKYSPGDPSADGFWDSVPGKDGEAPELVKVYHGTSTEQLDALVDLLMNLDKYAESKASIAELVQPPPAADGAAPSEAGEANTGE